MLTALLGVWAADLLFQDPCSLSSSPSPAPSWGAEGVGEALVRGVGPTVDAVRVDLQQDGGAVPGAAGDLGRRSQRGVQRAALVTEAPGDRRGEVAARVGPADREALRNAADVGDLGALVSGAIGTPR
jgi:hypothetical protein